MISSKENTRRLFNRANPERAGLHDSPWARTVQKWVTQGYPTHRVTRKVNETVKENGRTVTREVENEVEEPVSPVAHFGFDMMKVDGGYDLMPIRGVREVVEETDEWQILRNGAGALLKWWKDKDGTPEHVDFSMTSREIWEQDYRPHLLDLDRDRVNVEGARRALEGALAQEKWTYHGNLFIWEQMRRSLGDLCMYESLVLDPDWIHDFNRVYTDHLKAHFQILLEEAGVPDGMWLYEDLGFKQRLFCSPKVLGDLFFPYYKEVVDFFHTYGVKVVLHTCGFTADALPLIVEAGFDGLNPMEVAAGNDILKFAEEYGERLVFIGGFDKRIIESHDRPLIRKEVTTFMREMKARGARFLFGSDHSISTNTDFEDFQYLLEVYREQMAY